MQWNWIETVQSMGLSSRELLKKLSSQAERELPGMFGTELDADVGLGSHVMGSIMIGTTNLLEVHSSICR